MRRKFSLSRRDALRFAFGASAAHAPLWLGSCASEDDFAQTGAGAGLSGFSDDAAVPIAPYDPELPWYLQNEYAPTQEEHDIFELEVSGAIPPELDGINFRNGPNRKGRDMAFAYERQRDKSSLLILDASDVTHPRSHRSSSQCACPSAFTAIGCQPAANCGAQLPPPSAASRSCHPRA